MSTTTGLARMREQVYKDPRPAEYFDRYYEHAQSHRPNWVYEMVRVMTVLYGLIVFRMRCVNSGNVPADGAVVLAPNHFSYMDHFFTGAFIRRRVRFMGKSQIFRWPLQWIYSKGGVFPVRRGHRDTRAMETARKILKRGEALVMYCQGGRSRSGEIEGPARPGIGKLAIQSGAPVVPVAIYGSQRVRNWKKLRFPKVWVRYGLPLHFPQRDNPTKEEQQAAADRILAAIRAEYTLMEMRLEARRRKKRR